MTSQVPGDSASDQSVDEPIVVLARHGETVLNANGVLRGHLDPPLDEAGLAEVAALGAAIAALLAPRRLVRIVASPLRRAVQTAQAIAARTSAPVELAPGLIDRDYGRWAGQSLEAVIAKFGSLAAAEGVEAADAVAARALAVLDAQRPVVEGGAVVLVAHDAVNRLLLASLDPSLGPADEIGQRTACWNVLAFHDGAWQVRSVDQKAPTSQ